MIAIAEHLQVPYHSVRNWKARMQWDKADTMARMESALELRWAVLVAKEAKEGRDFKELDLLGRQIERMARVRRYESGGNETDLNPNVANRNAGPKRAPKRNFFSEE